jgi:predicted phosphodiesterase
MRLLAFSDIHHNLVAVRKLRAAERNSFDAIVVAGDIGNESAADFFKILAAFKCPVLYVYGNWDNDLGYGAAFGNDCHLLQSNVITIGDISFTGFSGCPTNWGRNPIFLKLRRQIEAENKGFADARNRGIRPDIETRGTTAYQKFELRLRSAGSEALRLNRERLANAVKRAKVDRRNCVVVTHERLSRLSEEVPGALLHLFGHLHRFSESTHQGTTYVNVAALDRPVSVRPRGRLKWGREDIRNINAGNYVKIEINRSRRIRVGCVNLAHDYPDWIPLQDRRYNGLAWVPEEAEWTQASDRPLSLRNTRIVKSDAT